MMISWSPPAPCTRCPGSPTRLLRFPTRDAPTESNEPRSVLRATVVTPSGPVHVVSAHFTHIGAEQRRAQASAVAGVAAGLDGPVVLAGDLNATIDAPALEPLTSWLIDAFEASGTPPGDPARRSCGPWAIDHVLVRGLEPSTCRVAREAGEASDHLPEIATIGWRAG